MSITFGIAIVQNVALGAPIASVARGIITGNFELFLVRIFCIFFTYLKTFYCIKPFVFIY